MGARWYLASIAMLALLCVAAHLSVQMYAQQMAEKLLQQWGKKAQVQIGNVHYHLLRNGLIVKQIHIEREGGSLSIAHMLIRANPRLLTSDSPQIGKIEMAGVKVRLWASEAENTWQQDEYLQRIWHASRSFSLHDGELIIFPRGKTAPPLQMTGLKLEQDYLFRQGRLVGSAQLQGKDIQIHWQINKENGSSSGQLSWQEVDAQLLSSSFGLQPEVGLLTGNMNWSQTDSVGPGIQKVTMEGYTQLIDVNDESNESHHLYWQGSQVAETWKVEVMAEAWPLDAWADELPRIGGRRMLAGQLDGSMQWHGQPGKWKINTDQGVIRHVVYAQENDHKTAGWHIGRLEYSNALIDQSKHQLQTSSILLADANITLQPASSLAIEILEKKPEGDWRIATDNIHIQNLALALSLKQGKVDVGPLYGKGNWKLGKALNFELHTQVIAKNTDRKQTENTVETTESWQFRGQTLQHQIALNDLKLKIRAQDVPLAKLRALIPLTGSKKSPLTLEGSAVLKLDVLVHDGVWRVDGKATAEHVVLAHAGDTWGLDHLSMKFGPVGTGLARQNIEKLEVQGWKYISALNPLPAHSVEPTVETETAKIQVPWWAMLLHRPNWKIDSIRLNDGTISLGRSEDYWARKLDIHLDHLQTDQWSKFEAAGKVGAGDITLKGTWDALGEVNRFRGVISLRNALPFFMNNWMTASGMPRLIRGRIFADLSVKDGGAIDSYQSSVQLRLNRGLTEMSASPNDPLLSRTGFGTSDILLHLDDGAGKAALQFETSGNWRTQPLNLDRLGISMQLALQQAAVKQMEKIGFFPPKKQENTREAHIRLHEGNVLSLNERIRLFKIVRILRKNPGWVVDLIPHWTGEEINADVLKRVLNTQNLIERYLLHRKVGKQKIFPLWPTVDNHADDIGSIRVSIGSPA